jgi:hypothetical protein
VDLRTIDRLRLGKLGEVTGLSEGELLEIAISNLVLDVGASVTSGRGASVLGRLRVLPSPEEPSGEVEAGEEPSGTEGGLLGAVEPEGEAVPEAVPESEEDEDVRAVLDRARRMIVPFASRAIAKDVGVPELRVEEILTDAGWLHREGPKGQPVWLPRS